MEKSLSPFLAGKKIFILLAVLYTVAAGVSVWSIIAHTRASTRAIEQILVTYNLKNEGEQAVDRYAQEHPLLGLFLSSPIKEELKLPSEEQSSKALSSDVERLLKTVRWESSVAAWWSWFLISLSLLYVVTVVALERNFTTRAVLFSLTVVSLVCFIIGILAPAMVIWTAPSIPMASGNLEFVLQHQVRGIAAIIWELLTTDHWIIGSFLLLFSILTPLTKASLMFFVIASRSKDLNFKIVQVLHAIGKWSSMTTSELLTHSGMVAGNDEKKADRKLGRGVISGLFAGLLGFVVVSGLYTYQQYTHNLKGEVPESSSPEKLNNADLVMPAHK